MLLFVDRIKPVFWENSRKKIWYGVIIRKKIWYGVIIVFDVGRVTRVQGNAISGRNSIGDVLRHCHIYGNASNDELQPILSSEDGCFLLLFCFLAGGIF